MVYETAIAQLSRDPVLASVIARLNLPETPERRELYPALLESIVYQQLSVKAAATIHRRFLDLFPERYPVPERLLLFSGEELRQAGLSRQKAAYLQNIARFALEKGMSEELLHNMSDEELLNYLTQIKGVGRWTVEMLLIFAMNRPDVFPVDDLGIQQSMKQLYRIEAGGKALRTQLTQIASAWQPYRSLASRYLWRWKDSLRSGILKQEA